jgi:hypothetical protein
LKKAFILIVVSILCQPKKTLSQADIATQQSCALRISLLTCTPGQELYSTFGHSAIRVFDSSKNSDLIFNYGTFDFYDPQFLTKFVKGKLLYFVSIDTITSFLEEYQYYRRGITEQVVNISCDEKRKLAASLFENAKEENKFYKYDFNYDNCTTRLRDMIEKAAGNQIVSKNILPETHTTFRDLIHIYLDNGGQHWSGLGIDILLGSPLDKKVTNREAMFLPDYLLMAFDSSTLNGKKLVSEKRILLNEFSAYKTKNIFTPLIVFTGLAILIFLISIFVHNPRNVYFQVFDFIFFLSLGLIGVLLIFMWFGTGHGMARNNFNLLWALPTHLPVAFMLFSKRMWVSRYFLFVVFYTVILIIAWFFLPQAFNSALLPIMGIVLVRSFYISKKIAIAARK